MFHKSIYVYIYCATYYMTYKWFCYIIILLLGDN